MVRTKADAGGTKVAGAKAPRKVLAPSPAGPSAAGTGTPSKASRYSGGNTYNPQPTPDWQKGIGAFFKQKPKEGEGSRSNSCGGEEENVRNDKNGGGSEGSSSGRSSPILIEHKEELQGTSKGNFEKNGMISDDDD